MTSEMAGCLGRRWSGRYDRPMRGQSQLGPSVAEPAVRGTLQMLPEGAGVAGLVGARVAVEGPVLPVDDN